MSILMHESLARTIKSVEGQFMVLSGQRVSELGNTSTLCDILVLQFATSGQAKQNYALFVDCAWRLEWNNRVIAGSEDGEPNRGSTELLLGQTLMRAEVFAP